MGFGGVGIQEGGLKLMRVALLVLAILLTGCVRVSTVPLATDVVQVTAQADSACGQEGAERAALHQASVETIKRGFDRFMVVGTNALSTVRQVGQTPITGQVTPYGNVNVYGGYPIYAETHKQVFTVQMFRTGDPAGNKALSARELLGDNWKELVAKDTPTNCLAGP